MNWSESGFGQRLDTAISRFGLTQKDFASTRGFDAATLSGWKKDHRPKYEDELRLATALEVRPAWLIYGDGFEPMDDEEKEMLTTYRRLKDEERADLRKLLATMTAGREPIKKPGARTLAKVVVDHDTKVTAIEATPSSASAPGASEPSKYQPMHLPQDEYAAVMKWLLPQISTMKKGLPVPKALRKIARQLADDNAPEALAKKQDQTAQGKDSRGKAAPKVESQPPRHAPLEKAHRRSS